MKGAYNVEIYDLNRVLGDDELFLPDRGTLWCEPLGISLCIEQSCLTCQRLPALLCINIISVEKGKRVIAHRIVHKAKKLVC
jgi:hypothetical protein